MNPHYMTVTVQDEKYPEDGYDISMECMAVIPACMGWIECPEPHVFDLNYDGDPMDDQVFHGHEHIHMEFGWAVNTQMCSLLRFPDEWQDSGYELAQQLGVGRHEIDFEWDESTIYVNPVNPVNPPVPTVVDILQEQREERVDRILDVALPPRKSKWTPWADVKKRRESQ